MKCVQTKDPVHYAYCWVSLHYVIIVAFIIILFLLLSKGGRKWQKKCRFFLHTTKPSFQMITTNKLRHCRCRCRRRRLRRIPFSLLVIINFSFVYTQSWCVWECLFIIIVTLFSWTRAASIQFRIIISANNTLIRKRCFFFFSYLETVFLSNFFLFGKCFSTCKTKEKKIQLESAKWTIRMFSIFEVNIIRFIFRFLLPPAYILLER